MYVQALAELDAARGRLKRHLIKGVLGGAAVRPHEQWQPVLSKSEGNLDGDNTCGICD